MLHRPHNNNNQRNNKTKFFNQKHYKEAHNCNITGSQILPNIKTFAKLSGKADLMILEALLMKQQRQMVNIEAEDFNRV